MDQLTLKNVRVSGKHGVYEQEKVQGNDFEVDLIFKGTFSSAAHSDDLVEAIDYSKAAELIQKVFHGPSQNLIERLAQQLLQTLTEAFPMAEEIFVRVRKLNPPMEPAADWAEIELSWPNS